MISNDLREREKMKIVEGYVVLSEKFEEIFHPDLLLVDSFRKINERKIISSFVFTVPPPPPQFLLRSDIIRSISYVPIMHVSLIQSFTLSMSILNSYARAIIKIFSRRGEIRWKIRRARDPPRDPSERWCSVRTPAGGREERDVREGSRKRNRAFSGAATKPPPAAVHRLPSGAA